MTLTIYRQNSPSYAEFLLLVWAPSVVFTTRVIHGREYSVQFVRIVLSNTFTVFKVNNIYIGSKLINNPFNPYAGVVTYIFQVRL